MISINSFHLSAEKDPAICDMPPIETPEGFTLMELLVSFSILSLLLVLIIQTNSETIFFLQRTSKLEQVQKVVVHELLKIERGVEKEENEDSEKGVYPEGHPLAGDIWTRTDEEEEILGAFKITRIKFRVTWKHGEEDQFFESSIWGL